MSKINIYSNNYKFFKNKGFLSSLLILLIIILLYLNHKRIREGNKKSVRHNTKRQLAAVKRSSSLHYPRKHNGLSRESRSPSGAGIQKMERLPNHQKFSQPQPQPQPQPQLQLPHIKQTNKLAMSRPPDTPQELLFHATGGDKVSAEDMALLISGEPQPGPGRFEQHTTITERQRGGDGRVPSPTYRAVQNSAGGWERLNMSRLSEQEIKPAYRKGNWGEIRNSNNMYRRMVNWNRDMGPFMSYHAPT